MKNNFFEKINLKQQKINLNSENDYWITMNAAKN